MHLHHRVALPIRCIPRSALCAVVLRSAALSAGAFAGALTGAIAVASVSASASAFAGVTALPGAAITASTADVARPATDEKLGQLQRQANERFRAKDY